MRVLRLCSVYETSAASAAGFDGIGGMQVHTARLTEALDGRGVAQTVITAYRPGAERDQLVGIGSRVLRVGAPIRRFRQLYGIAAVPRVQAVAGTDLIHVHMGEDLAIIPLAQWAATRLRVPLVATVHCSLAHTLVAHNARSWALRTFGGPIQSALLREATGVLVLSDRLAERLVTSGLSRSRVGVLPLGIETRATQRPQSMGEGRWVVYAGRLVPEKGVRDLVLAFGMLRTPGIGLLVVGDGPDRRALERLARRKSRRVRFVGAIPHAQVGAYVQHADVVVLPSWFEERGRLVLEAMAAGTPVVATRTGGIPSSVTDGVDGLLVEPRDAKGLSEAIDRILGDGALAVSISAAARQAASGHGTDSLADATLAAYERVLDRSRGRTPARVVSVR